WRGPGSSPIVHGDHLFLTFDGYDRQYLVALNKKDGKTAWEKDRTIDYQTENGDLRKAYSTPTVITVDGQDQLVSPGARGIQAYDVNTGEVLWTVHVPRTMNAASPPLFAHGRIYVTVGSAQTLLAIRPTGKGDVTKTHVDWSVKRNVPS